MPLVQDPNVKEVRIKDFIPQDNTWRETINDHHYVYGCNEKGKTIKDLTTIYDMSQTSYLILVLKIGFLIDNKNVKIPVQIIDFDVEKMVIGGSLYVLCRTSNFKDKIGLLRLPLSIMEILFKVAITLQL